MTEYGVPDHPLRILCVDDNELLAASMNRFVRQDASFQWLGWLSDPDRVIPALTQLKPHIILMDIDMPGVDTFRLVRTISEGYPDVRVVMFSGHVNAEYLDRALDCGAWGYLCKDEEPTALLDGLRRVAGGELAFGKEVLAVQRSREP
jgi:DNA-binding NarL/FixJ family response regulator